MPCGRLVCLDRHRERWSALGREDPSELPPLQQRPRCTDERARRGNGPAVAEYEAVRDVEIGNSPLKRGEKSIGRARRIGAFVVAERVGAPINTLGPGVGGLEEQSLAETPIEVHD